jgi:hypothetical protein
MHAALKRNRCDVFGPPTLFLLNVSFCFPGQRESLREQRKKDKSRFRFFGGRHQPSHTKTITNRQAEMKKREKKKRKYTHGKFRLIRNQKEISIIVHTNRQISKNKSTNKL